MEIKIGDTCLKVFENGEIWRKRQNKWGTTATEYTIIKQSDNECRNNATIYKQFKLNGKFIGSHRVIAHAYLGLDLLSNMVDHIDFNGSNNNVSNLEVVTNQQNCCNKQNSKHYYYHTQSKTYRVGFRINGKQIHLGQYHTEAEAQQKALTITLELLLSYT
jgi:hypothetical protein